MRALVLAVAVLAVAALLVTSCQPKQTTDEGGPAVAPKAPTGAKPSAAKPADTESADAGAGAMVSGDAGESDPAAESTGAAAATDGAVEWADSLDSALERAKAEDKLVLLDMAAEWCGPCKMLAEEVWNSGDADAVLAKFVPVLVDVDANPEVADKYGSGSIPHVCILDADGNKVDETIGYPGKDEMIKWLESKTG